MDYKNKEKEEKKVIKVEDEQKKLQEENAKKNKEQEERRKTAEAAKKFDEEQKKEQKKAGDGDGEVDLTLDREMTVEGRVDDEFRTFIMDQAAAKRKLNVSNKGDFKRVKDFMTYTLDEENFMNNTWSLTDEEKQRIMDTRSSWWFGKRRAKKLQKKLCTDRNFKIGAGLFAQRRALQAVLADEIDKGEAEYEKYGMRSTKDIYIESKNLLKCHYIEGTLGEKFKAFWGYKPHSKVNVAAAAKHAVNSSVYCEIKMREFAKENMIVNRQINENAKNRLIALCKAGYANNMLISDSMDVNGHNIGEELQKKARMRASLFEMLQFFIENAGSDVFFSAGISTWGQLFKVANDAAKAAASSVGNMGKEEKKAYYTAIMNGVITNKIREARLGLEGIYDLKKKTEEIEKKEENKAENKDAKKEEKKEEKKDAGAENKDGDQKQGEVKDEKKDKKKKKKKEEDAYGRSEEEIAEDNRYIRAVKIAERDVAQKEAKAAEHKAQETAVWKAVWGTCHTFDASDAAAKDADEKWIRGVQRNELAWMKDRLEDINNTVANFTFSEEMKNPEEYIKTHFKEYMKLRGYFMAYEKLTDLSWFKGEQKEYSAIKDFFKDKRGSYLLIFGDQKAREVDKKRIAPWKLFQSVVDRLLIQKGYNPDMTGDVSGYVTREQWKNAQWKDEKEKTDTIDKAVKSFEKNNAELLRDEFVMNYAHFYGYKDAETKADHEGFQEKIVNLLDKTAKPGTEAGLQKVLGGLKVDLQGAIDSIKGMVKYFNRYPVAKYPDMYKGLEAFTSKKETPETLAEKLTSLSLTYNGYLDFINKYNNNDKLVTGVVEEALNDKTADFRELVERGNQTVIANHYVKGGDYKTFRAVNKMNDYYSKYNKGGYENDYVAAMDYVENFKFSKEWFKPEYVMDNMEQYLRFNFSIKTIRENAHDILAETSKLHQEKINSILTLGDAFMRIVNHNMAEKFKINCGGGGYATDDMVAKAVEYHSKENKKEPELEDFKSLESIADLLAWNQKHINDANVVLHDYVWDHKVFELGLKDLRARDYAMKVVNGKSEYADYLRLLAIKTRQMDSKGLTEHQKNVFAGQVKILARRALICLREGKFSRIDGIVSKENSEFDNKVIDILNGFVNGTRQEGDLDTILQAFNKEQEYRAKYIESVRKKRKYESETKMSNARFSRKINVGFSMKYEAKKLTGIVQKEAEKLLSILDIEIENQTSEDVKKKLENISTLIREGLKPENAEGAEPVRSIADALKGVDEDFPVSDAVKKELMKVRFMSVHLHESCEIVTKSGNAVMNTERQLACVSSVATYYELSEKRKALRKLPKAQQTKEVQDELEKLDDMIDDLNCYLDDLVDMSTGKATMKSLPSYIRLNNNKEELKSLVNETSLVLTSDAEKLRDRIAGLDEIDDVVSRKKRIDANKIGKSIKFAVSRKGTYKDGNSMSFAIDNILRYRGITLSQHALETWRPGTTDVADKTDEYQEKMEKLADRFDSGDVDILDYARLINKVLPDASIRHRKIDKKALKSDAGANALKSTFREAVKEDRSPLALKMNGKYYTVTSFVESEEEGAKVTLSYQNEKDITLSIEELMAKSTETAPKDAPAEEKHQYNTGIELTWLKDIAFTKNTAAHLRTFEKNGVVSWIKGDVVESYHISSDAEMEAYKVMHPEDYAEWKKVNDMRKESLSSLTTRVIKHKDGSVVFLDDDSKVEVRGREIERVNGFLAKEDICVEEKGLGKNVTGETIYPNRYEELKKVEADEIKELNKALYDEKKTGLDHSNATKALLEQKASVPSLIENMIDQSIQRSLMNFQSEFRKLSSAENTDEFLLGKAEVEKKFKSKLDKYEEFRKAQDRIKELDHRWKDPNPVSLDKITENKTLALNAAEDFRKRLSDNNASGAVAAYGLVVCYINPVKKVLSWSKRRELSKKAVSVSGLRKAFKEAYDKVEKEYAECGKEVDEFYANRRKEQEKKVALGEMDESKITKGLAYKFTFKDLPEIFKVTDDPEIVKQLLDSKVPIHPEAREMLNNRLKAIKQINNGSNRKEFIMGNKSIVGNWYDISVKGVSDEEYNEMTTTQYKEYEYSFKVSELESKLREINVNINAVEKELKAKPEDKSLTRKLRKLISRKNKIDKQKNDYYAKKNECINKLATYDEKKKTLKKVYMQPISDKLEKFKKFKFSKSNDIMADYLSVMLTFATGKQQDANIISGYRPSMDLSKGVDDECMKYMESQQREQFKDISDYADLTSQMLSGAALQQYEIDITKIKSKGKKASNVDRNEVANKIKNLVLYNVTAQSSPLCLKTQSGSYVLVTGYMEGGNAGDCTEDKLLTLTITDEGTLTESTVNVFDLFDYGSASKLDSIQLFTFQSVEGLGFMPYGSGIKYNKENGQISSIKGNEESSAHQSNCVKFCIDEENIGKVTTYCPKTIMTNLKKKAGKNQESAQATASVQRNDILVHQNKTEAHFKTAEETLRQSNRHFIESGKKLEYSELGYYRACGNVDMLNHLLTNQSDILSDNVKEMLRERIAAISKVEEICQKAVLKDSKCKEIVLDDGTSEIRIDATKYDSTSSSNAGKWSDAMSFLLSTKGVTVNADTLEKYRPEISYSGVFSYSFLETHPTAPGEIEDYVNLLDEMTNKELMLNVKNYDFSKDADDKVVIPVLKDYVKDLFQNNGSGVVLKVPDDPDMYRNVVGIKGDSLIIKASAGLGTDEQYKGDEYTDKYVEKELGRGTMEYELPLSELKGKKFSFVSISKKLSDFDADKRKETLKTALDGVEKEQFRVRQHQDKMINLEKKSRKVCDGLKASETTWLSRQYLSDHLDETVNKVQVEEELLVENEAKKVEKKAEKKVEEKKPETKAEKKAREKREADEKKAREKKEADEKKRLEKEEKQRLADEKKRLAEEEKKRKEEEKKRKEEEKRRKEEEKRRKKEEEDEHNLRFVNEEYYMGDGMGGDFM